MIRVDLHDFAGRRRQSTTRSRPGDGSTVRLEDDGRQSPRQHWEARTPAEREQFTRLFADVFRQAYLALILLVAAQDRGPQWRVEDVRVESISLLDNYRTQFDSIIVRSSYEALIKRSQDRLKQPG
jgi:ABC-type transporter MlaC component